MPGRLHIGHYVGFDSETCLNDYILDPGEDIIIVEPNSIILFSELLKIPFRRVVHVFLANLGVLIWYIILGFFINRKICQMNVSF